MTTVAEATAALPTIVPLAKGIIGLTNSTGDSGPVMYVGTYDETHGHLIDAGFHALAGVLPCEKAEERTEAPAPQDLAADGDLALYDLALVRSRRAMAAIGASFLGEQPRRLAPVAKSEESRVIYYVVTAPGQVDAHGHAMTAEEIAEGCWGFPKSFRVKLEHGRPEAMAAWKAAGVCDDMGYLQGAEIVESYLLPVDLAEGDLFHGAPVNQDIPAGSHIAAIRYPLPVWPEFRDTDHGISWGGYAAEVPA
jgi:hypothetical protein